VACSPYSDLTVAAGRTWADSFVLWNTDSAGNIITPTDLTGKTVSATLVTSTTPVSLTNGSGIAITTPLSGLVTITLTVPQLATLVLDDKVIMQVTIWNADGTEYTPIDFTYMVRAG
jgi:hypothetical protein